MTSSKRRIVVAVDSSANARLALEHAVRRAGPGGELIVAYVVKTLPETLAKVLVVGDEHREIARQLVNQFVGAYAPGADPVVLEGPVAQSVADFARERGADEIVIGSRGLGRFSAALGSVSHALLQLADHPVSSYLPRPPTIPVTGTRTADAPWSSATTDPSPLVRRWPMPPSARAKPGTLSRCTPSNRCRTGWDGPITSRRWMPTRHMVTSCCSH